jgi:hypothetical protein
MEAAYSMVQRKKARSFSKGFGYFFQQQAGKNRTVSESNGRVR